MEAERERLTMGADGSGFSKESHLETVERWFWQHVEDQVAETGETEQEVLNAIKTPGLTGRRARHRMQARPGETDSARG